MIFEDEINVLKIDLDPNNEYNEIIEDIIKDMEYPIESLLLEYYRKDLNKIFIENLDLKIYGVDQEKKLFIFILINRIDLFEKFYELFEIKDLIHFNQTLLMYASKLNRFKFVKFFINLGNKDFIKKKIQNLTALDYSIQIYNNNKIKSEQNLLSFKLLYNFRDEENKNIRNFKEKLFFNDNLNINENLNLCILMNNISDKILGYTIQNNNYDEEFMEGVENIKFFPVTNLNEINKNLFLEEEFIKILNNSNSCYYDFFNCYKDNSYNQCSTVKNTIFLDAEIKIIFKVCVKENKSYLINIILPRINMDSEYISKFSIFNNIYYFITSLKNSSFILSNLNSSYSSNSLNSAQNFDNVNNSYENNSLFKNFFKSNQFENN